MGPLLWLGGIFLALSACSFPRILVLHDPLTAVQHLELGQIYEAGGDYDRAREEYRIATKRDPTLVGALIGLGNVAYQSGDPDGAVSFYRMALEHDPPRPEVMNNLAWAYLAQGRQLEEAEQLVRRALSADPPQTWAYRDTLGVLLHRRGALEAARAEFAAALSAQEEIPPAAEVEITEHLAALLFTMERPAEACAALARVAHLRGEGSGEVATERCAGQAPEGR